MGRIAEIFIAGASNRTSGVQRALGNFDLSDFSGNEIALKANFNSADPPPASTSIETLDALCTAILAEKPKKLTLAERSGMGTTREVLETRGVIALSVERGFSAIVLDELDRTGWSEIQAPGLHWSRGFFISGIFTRADRVVQICCLKTHRFGGHFTLSLKNSVGLVAKRVPGVNYDFMGELHNSRYQRLMIAEINKFYRTDLVIMDATDGFTSGGPDKGKRIHPEVILAGTDRVAIDAVGLPCSVPMELCLQLWKAGSLSRSRLPGLPNWGSVLDPQQRSGSPRSIRLLNPSQTGSRCSWMQTSDRNQSSGFWPFTVNAP